MSKIINILIADDHTLVRGGVKFLLERQAHFRVVAEAKTGSEAIEKAIEYQPDVAILDIRMPGMSGIEACRQITQSVAGCKVLMLTAYAEDDLLFAAIQAGAAGYVLKLIAADELIRAVEWVSRGEGFIDSAMLKSVFKAMNKATGARHAAQFSPLTTQEMRVLLLLSKGLTNRQIGTDLYLGEGTVRNYVSSIMTKLALVNRAQAAAFAVEHKLGEIVTT